MHSICQASILYVLLFVSLFCCRKDDFGFVKTEIIDILHENNYCVCLEAKDFVPGLTRQRNVSAAMEHSRRMICYITEFGLFI